MTILFWYVFQRNHKCYITHCQLCEGISSGFIPLFREDRAVDGAGNRFRVGRDLWVRYRRLHSNVDWQLYARLLFLMGAKTKLHKYTRIGAKLFSLYCNKSQFSVEPGFTAQHKRGEAHCGGSSGISASCYLLSEHSVLSIYKRIRKAIL